MKQNYYHFLHHLSESMKDADIVFITVGTPSRRLEDDADLSYVWSVAEEISKKYKKILFSCNKINSTRWNIKRN